MKEHKCQHCPRCGRHCRRDCLRCERGAAYFDRLEGRAPEHKWEKNLAPGSLAHRFIETGRGMKKRAAKGKISEEAFLAALSASEQVTLDEILRSLEPLTRKKHGSGRAKQGI